MIRFKSFLQTLSEEKVYHGGYGVDSLHKEFKVLSDKDKQKFPSSNVGLNGLSMTTDKNIAKEYSKNIAGHDRVFSAKLNPKAKIHNIDTKGEGIDEHLSYEDIEKLKNKGYHAIRDISKESKEKEIRILHKDAISHE